jgi:hypothetical protein
MRPATGWADYFIQFIGFRKREMDITTFIECFRNAINNVNPSYYGKEGWNK